MYINELAFLFVGILLGVGITRYGIGLGFKMFAQSQSEKLFEKLDEPIEQEYTQEEEEE